MYTAVVIERIERFWHSTTLTDMWRLRARVFHDELGWDVKLVKGPLGEFEYDEFDRNHGAVYIAVRDGRTITACLRLLPTTGPTLLAKCFADTHPDIAGLASPEIWECTRVCVAPEYRKDARAILRLLFATVGRVCLKAGITSLVANFDSHSGRVFRSVGLQFEIIGKNGNGVMLGSFPITEELTEKLEEGSHV